MKNTIKVDMPKKRNIAVLVFVSMCILAWLACLTLVGVEMSKLNMDNTALVTGTVVAVEQKDELERIKYEIELDDGNTYQILNIFAQNIKFDELKAIESENATLHILKGRTNIYGIDSTSFSLDTQESLQIQLDNLKPALIIVIVLLVLTILALIALIVYFMKNGNKQKEIDVLQTIANDIRVAPIRKSINIKYFISLAVMLVVFIPIIIVEGNKNANSITFFAFLYTFIGLFAFWCIFALILIPIKQKKEIEFCNHLYGFENFVYLKEATNSFLDQGNDMLVKFEENGMSVDTENMREMERTLFSLLAEMEAKKDSELDVEAYKEALKQQFGERVTSQNPEFLGTISYEELKLHLRVIFKPSGAIAVFICSNLDADNKYGLKHDIMVELSPSSYFFVKKYALKIDGLKNFMTNRLALMQKYCKGKTNVQDITD